MFNCKSESDGASSTRKVGDPLFGLPDLAIRETRGGRRETGAMNTAEQC
jgi:hypothetical protein